MRRFHGRAKSPVVILLAVVAMAVVTLGSSPLSSKAATPSSGTVVPASPVVTWTGPPKTATTLAVGLSQTDVDLACAVPGAYCDDLALHVGVTAAYWTSHSGGVAVTISWPSTSNDFDLDVFDPSGNIVATSGGTNNTSESVVIPAAVGDYVVRAVYYSTTDAGYSGRAVLSTTANGGGTTSPPPPPAGTPTFLNYVSPPGLGDDATEPTIGVDSKTGKVMMGFTDAAEIPTQTLRVSFDDCSSPTKATWENVPVPTGVATNDTIEFVDHLPSGTPDRCFDSKLVAGTKQSLMGYSDDDGTTWNVSAGSGINSGVDHQTLGAGPYRAGVVVPHTYPHAVYYCAQDSADANCARSDDGGRTFGPAIPIYTRDQCTGIHGHIKVAADGIAYVPNRSCHDLTTIAGLTPKSGAAVIRSEDNGLTWTLGAVAPGADSGVPSWDPSVGIATDGTLYMGYENGDGHQRVAVSHDHGATWVHDQELGLPFGIQTSAFPAAVAGDPNRAAVAFYGTSEPGDASNMTTFKGAWYLYLSTTFDGGQTWTTTNLTPNDPVQRGSICTHGTQCTNSPDDRNLADFMDATIDPQGRILVGWDDGCVGDCVSGTTNSYTADGVISRQSGGKRMLAADDPPASILPGAPAVSASKDVFGTVHLSWATPEPGTSPILGYHVYRRDPNGSYPGTPLATTTNNKYDDDAGGVDYVYEVKAFTALGEGPNCGEVASASLPVLSGSCQRPGVAVLQDAAGDAISQQAGQDLRAVGLSEPYFGPGQDKVVFSIKVGSLSTVPPSTQWPLLFTGADGKGYLVDMLSDPLGAVTFDYGTVIKNSDGTYGAETVVGPADAASAFSADGTITIIVDRAKIGGGSPGGTVKNFIIRVTQKPANITPDNAPDDLKPTGSYTLVGNEACKPNHPPLAALDADQRDGDAPLRVAFDGAKSSDTDGDAIASYTFLFGDGTSAVTQSSPTARHTYRRDGEYKASLKVKDSRGFVSVNIAQVSIDAGTEGAADTGTPKPLPATGSPDESVALAGAALAVAALLAVRVVGRRNRSNGDAEGDPEAT